MEYNAQRRKWPQVAQVKARERYSPFLVIENGEYLPTTESTQQEGEGFTMVRSFLSTLLTWLVLVWPGAPLPADEPNLPAKPAYPESPVIAAIDWDVEHLIRLAPGATCGRLHGWTTAIFMLRGVMAAASAGRTVMVE